MNGEMFIVFAILLLGFILFTFLGSSFWKEGFETLFTGPNGGSAVLTANGDGTGILTVTSSSGTQTSYAKTSNSTDSKYYSSDGGSAVVNKDALGTTTVVVTSKDGTTTTYSFNDRTQGNADSTTTTTITTSTNGSSTYDNYNHYDQSSYPTIFYGPDGGTARVIQTPNDNTIVVTNKNGSTDIYYIDNNANTGTVSTYKYYGPNGGSAKMINDANGKKAVEITGPSGSKVVYTGDNAYTYNGYDNTINQYSSDTNTTGSDYNTAYNPPPATTTNSTYYNSLPSGIPRSMIPAGQEDLYILKSEVVPPVCPKCPDPIVKSSDTPDLTKCPPCPPCARCPEPAFDCKKVPNYNAFNPDYMPVPVLSDFSGFGM
jgi:hypothetical protein